MAQHQTNSGPGEARLDGLSVAVVGAGRIGLALVRNLARMGAARIDVYEREPRAADRVRDCCRVYAGDAWDELTLARLGRYDFAACTVQDHDVRVRVNQKCLVANVSLVQAWTAGSDAIVAAYPFGVLDDCACYECDARRSATPLPLASLRLTMEPTGAETGDVSTASIAGALAAALMARVASGTHGAVARRAALDTATGQGTTHELYRDPACVRCTGLVRPMPVVHTRNCWAVPAWVARTCPGTLEQDVRLSDAVDGLPGQSVRLGELVERFKEGPVPAKFALTTVDGRVVCLDFEDVRRDDASTATAPAAVTGR